MFNPLNLFRRPPSFTDLLKDARGHARDIPDSVTTEVTYADGKTGKIPVADAGLRFVSDTMADALDKRITQSKARKDIAKAIGRLKLVAEQEGDANG